MPTFSSEQLLFGRQAGLRTCLVSAIDGSITTDSISLQGNQYCAILPSLVWAHKYFSGGNISLRILDASFNVIANPTTYLSGDAGNSWPVSCDWNHTFYQGRDGRTFTPKRNVKITAVSDAGVVGTVWTLPYHTINGFAVNAAGTILYFAEDCESAEYTGTAGHLSPIHRWDLVNDVALSDLTAEGANHEQWGVQWLCHPDTGNLFIPHFPDKSAAYPDTYDQEILRINGSTGATLGTYAAGNSFNDISLALDLTDHAAIWAWLAHDDSLTTMSAVKLKISDMTAIRTLSHSSGNAAGNWPADGLFFAMSLPADSASCSGGGEINVVADPTDGQPFTGRSLSPRSWLTYDYDDADRGFALDTLNHPDTYYGGQKLGNLISIGTVERALSGRDSPYKMGNGQAEVDDSSRLLSTLEATAGSEFWFNREITVNLTPASAVALGQTPHTRFRGIVTGYPTVGLQRSIAFTSVLGSEFSPLDLDRMIPSRQIKDDFPDAPTDSLDKYVPIGMGIFPDRGATAVPITTGVENVVATLQAGPAAVTGFTATFGAGAPGGSFGDYRDLGEGLLLFYEVRQRVGGVWSEPAQASVTTGAGGGHVDLAWTPDGSATAIQIAVSGRSDFLQFSCLTTELSGATTTATDITGGIKEGFNTLDIWTLGLRINEFYTVFAALDDGSFSLGGGSNQLIIAPAFPDRLYNADVTWDAYVPPTGRTVTGYRIIRHRSYYSDWGPVYDWQGEVGAAVLTVADVGHGTAYYDSYVDNPLVQFPGGASSQDGVVIAIPAGKEVIGGTTYNRLVLFGHAIRDIDGIYKSRDIQGAATTSTVPIYDAVAAGDFGSTWLAPGYTGWPFANDYVPYGTDNNWYTVIFTTIDPLPTSILVRCCAMEDVGDATGSTIDGAARQFFHLAQNFILPPAGEVWTSGPWLAPREFDDGTPVINSLAIDALEAIEVARIGRYYRGQIYLDQPITIRDLLGRFFDSFGIRFGENHHGQLIGVHLDDFADLSSLTVLTDVREIVDDTRMDPRLTEMANTERYDYGYRPAESKQFLRLNESQADSIAIGTDGDTTVSPAIPRTGNRGRVKSHSRQMYYVDDPVTADDVVARDLAFYKYPPRYVQIVCGLQAVPVTLGSIVAVTDFQGIGADGWTERPLWVLGIQDVYNDLNTPPTITLTCVDVLRVLSGFGLWADGSVPSWASSTEAEQANNMYWADASDLMSDGAPAKVWG